MLSLHDTTAEALMVTQYKCKIFGQVVSAHESISPSHVIDGFYNRDEDALKERLKHTKVNY